jgi:hypothetical protein
MNRQRKKRTPCLIHRELEVSVQGQMSGAEFPVLKRAQDFQYTVYTSTALYAHF